MRKHITIWLALLLLAGAASAMEFPDQYYGIKPDPGCQPIQVYVTDFYDREPWSVPDPTGKVWQLGQMCIEDGAATLELDTLAWRICNPAFFGGPGAPDVCTAWYAGSINEWHHMAWEGDSYTGFYISAVWYGDVYLYESLTFNEDGTITFVQGAFEYDGPLWLKESESYTRLAYDVAPKEVQLIGRVPKATRRIGE